MSLILDALRRADAERARGAVPGLHTPQAPAVQAPAGRSRRAVASAAVVAVVAVVGGMAWWMPWGAGGGEPVAAVSVPVAPPVEAPRKAAADAAPPRAGASVQDPVTQTPAVVRPATPAAAAEPPQVAAESPRIEPLPMRQAVQPVAPPPSPKPPVPAPADAAAATAAKVPMLQELAPGIRQQLPALAVAGASYSADPNFRMVIVNGQVLREGDTAAPGVVLESIAARYVVLRRGEQRWRVPY